MKLIGTKQVAEILQVHPGRLTRAIWLGQIDTPVKGPGGGFIWSVENIRQASWKLNRRDLDITTLRNLRGENEQ